MIFPDSWANLLLAHDPVRANAALARAAQIEDQIAQSGRIVYPEPIRRYRALELVSPEQCKVCIIGQDPYHGVVQAAGLEEPLATGLSFSVPNGERLPPSLKNIFKELAQDMGGPLRTDGDLSDWADQGVLLLNAVLSVEKGRARSHHKLGWQSLTELVVEALSHRQRGVVFVLWGNDAKDLKTRICLESSVTLESSHPSSIGGACYKGFYGSRPFSRANHALEAAGRKPIVWNDSRELW